MPSLVGSAFTYFELSTIFRKSEECREMKSIFKRQEIISIASQPKTKIQQMDKTNNLTNLYDFSQIPHENSKDLVLMLSTLPINLCRLCHSQSP